MIDIVKFFEEHDDEYRKHQRITQGRRLHARPDLNAFLLLDKLVPGEIDMISVAEHDEICFSVNGEELEKVAAAEDLIDLIRCGVKLDPKGKILYMYV